MHCFHTLYRRDRRYIVRVITVLMELLYNLFERDLLTLARAILSPHIRPIVNNGQWSDHFPAHPIFAWLNLNREFGFMSKASKILLTQAGNGVKCKESVYQCDLLFASRQWTLAGNTMPPAITKKQSQYNPSRPNNKCDTKSSDCLCVHYVVICIDHFSAILYFCLWRLDFSHGVVSLFSEAGD